MEMSKRLDPKNVGIGILLNVLILKSKDNWGDRPYQQGQYKRAEQTLSLSCCIEIFDPKQI